MRAILFPSSTPGRKRIPGPTAGMLALGLTLGIGSIPASVHAAAYVNDAQSPAGVGLAGAMVARADDASAIFYNPAGLGYQSGLSVLAGVSLALPQQSATDSLGNIYNAQGGIFTLPTIYLAARVSDRIALGFGAFVHHGGGADWPDDNSTLPFPGRFLALRTKIQSITFNPSIAIRVIPEVSLGGGIDIELGSLEVIRALALGTAEARINFSGSTVAVGGNIGALARLLDGRLNFGLTYRSALNLHFDAMPTATTAPAGISLITPYTQTTSDLQAPHTVSLGVAGKPARFLTISADVIRSLWSSVHDQRFVLSDGKNQMQTTVVPRNWQDTFSARLGVELDLGPLLASSKLWPKIRVGFGYDQSPAPASTLSVPDADRFLPSVGLSLGYRGLGSIEVGYQAVIFKTQTSENPDAPPLTYSSMINVFSVALNLQLEKVFGKRSPEFASRLLERSPELPPEEMPPGPPPAETTATP